MESLLKSDKIIGCLLGTAVGDAIGLPYEGLTRLRGRKIFGTPDRHRFFFGRGMVSDDTEHTCMVAQALIIANGDVEVFRRSLAWSFRIWLLAVPAGVGLATLRSIVRLWIGYSPQHSGAFSAGNGSAMRAAILGVSINDPAKLREFVQASSRITHTDPKAEYGAMAIAIAPGYAANTNPIDGNDFLKQLAAQWDDQGDELFSIITKAVASVQAGETTEAFAAATGMPQRVSGYTYHTVPIALHAWLSHPADCRNAIEAVIRCGGDTDSVAAIVGGIVGASVGSEGIPEAWTANLIEWPRTTSWIRQLGTQLSECLASNKSQKTIRLSILGTFLRNAFFLAIVLIYGLRRLVPPY